MTLPYSHRLVSGAIPGPFAKILRIPLYPLSWLYSLVSRVRNMLYDHGLLRISRVPKPVISVGNLTLGGTGKTPFVAFVCALLSQKGLKPVVLARGYGSRGKAAPNDESLELGEQGISVVCNPDRVAAAIAASDEADVFVLDDGFQHRRIARDFDIVLVDATNPTASDHIFPAGLLRESVYSLRRAHCIVVTRANLVPDTGPILDRLAQIAPGVLICLADYVASGLVDSDGNQHDLHKIKGARVVAFCAIGHPEQFYASLINSGADIRAKRTYADHYIYSAADVSDIENAKAEANADMIVTTDKDWMKYRTVDRIQKVFILKQVVKLSKGSDKFNSKLSETAGA